MCCHNRCCFEKDTRMISSTEAFFLDRLRSDLNQEDFARRKLKISKNTYRKVESGRAAIPLSWKVPEIKNITDLERYILLRRRAGWTKEQLTDKISYKNGWDGIRNTQRFARWEHCTANALEQEELGMRRLNWLPFFWGDTPL